MSPEFSNGKSYSEWNETAPRPAPTLEATDPPRAATTGGTTILLLLIIIIIIRSQVITNETTAGRHATEAFQRGDTILDVCCYRN